MDIAVPGDANITDREKEKIQKYQDLRREIARLWDVKMCMVPVVVGSLGMVTNTGGPGSTCPRPPVPSL